MLASQERTRDLLLPAPAELAGVPCYVLDAQNPLAERGATERGAAWRRLRRVVSPESPVTRRLIDDFCDALCARHRMPDILVVGGASRGQGTDRLYQDASLYVHAFDITPSPDIQFIADAQRIPAPDETFDGVVVQAVLEHVLDPHQVVNEIWRVLRPGGLVYAETPFLQAVHEGSRDFTRFTHSGHRYLFRQFEERGSGIIGGPATSTLWAIDYLARGLFRSRRAGAMAKLAFFWLQYLDRWIPPDRAIDAACGVYFLGEKREGCATEEELIRYYKGALRREDSGANGSGNS
jgi:SAM-dependent methyltransferase